MGQPAEIIEHQPQAVALPANHGGTLTMIEVVERAMNNPNIDVEKLERVLAMAERMKAAEARTAYYAELVVMKPKLPVIERNGRIVIHEKGTAKIAENVIQSTPYARWEDIDAAITPTLTEHGFVLSFKTGVALDGKITVTGILAHKLGHTEETTITLPHDSSGSKNSVQAVGSSTSYGRRYTATLLLNIRTKGEDDDGKSGGAPETITEAQFARLQKMIDDTHADVPRFCKHFKIAAVKELPSGKFEDAVAMLERKSKK